MLIYSEVFTLENVLNRCFKIHACSILWHKFPVPCQTISVIFNNNKIKIVVWDKKKNCSLIQMHFSHLFCDAFY